jgi:Flp pilus assembly protein TadG
MIVVLRKRARAIPLVEGAGTNCGASEPKPIPSRVARGPADRAGYRTTSRRHQRRRGAAAAELALLLPLLGFMLVGAIDFCRLFYTYTTIANCARNGALWLSDPLASTQSPYASFQIAALADATDLNPALTTSNITSSSGTDSNGDSVVTVTVQYTFNLITSYLGYKSVSLARQVTMRVAPAAPN